MRKQSERVETRRRVPRHAPLALLMALTVLIPTAARADGLEVDVTERAGVYQVRGSFITNVPVQIVWDVLTDYGHIGSFVQSVKKSSIEPRPNGHLLVRQEMLVGVFPLRRKAEVALDVREDARQRIAFHDELAKDFRVYVGHWTLETDSLRTVVRYSLDADPLAGLPHFIGRGVLSHGAQDLLKQVEVEMERRARARGPARR